MKNPAVVKNRKEMIILLADISALGTCIVEAFVGMATENLFKLSPLACWQRPAHSLLIDRAMH